LNSVNSGSKPSRETWRRCLSSLTFLILVQTGTAAGSGWFCSFQPVGLGVGIGGVHQVVSTGNFAHPVSAVSWTSAGAYASARLVEAAIGWQFGDVLGLAVGSQLAEVDALVTWSQGPAASRGLYYLAPLNLYLHVTKRLGSPDNASRPMLVGSLGAGLTVQYPGFGPRLSAAISCEWDWFRLRPGICLRYSDSQTAWIIDDFGTMAHERSLSAGLTIHLGGW
jgi:hypothetical protein